MSLGCLLEALAEHLPRKLVAGGQALLQGCPAGAWAQLLRGQVPQQALRVGSPAAGLVLCSQCLAQAWLQSLAVRPCARKARAELPLLRPSPLQAPLPPVKLQVVGLRLAGQLCQWQNVWTLGLFPMVLLQDRRWPAT